MLCHSVRSCHWPSLPLNFSLVATENFATCVPCGVNFISGSFPRFPTRMTLFTPFMSAHSFEMHTITEWGGPETVSHVPKICDESDRRWTVGTLDAEPRKRHRNRCRDGLAASPAADGEGGNPGEAPAPTEDPIEHQVDDHARHRDVEPEGKRPARDGPMPVKLSTQGARERNDHHRHNDHRQDRVRDQDREVEGPRPTGAAKMHRSDVIVVVEIRNQKKRRGSERGQHHGAVRRPVTARDEHTSRDQEQRARSVQRGVDLWEKGEVGHGRNLVVRGTERLGKVTGKRNRVIGPSANRRISDHPTARWSDDPILTSDLSYRM